MRDFKRIQNEPPEGIQAAPLGKHSIEGIYMCARCSDHILLFGFDAVYVMKQLSAFS